MGGKQEQLSLLVKPFVPIFYWDAVFEKKSLPCQSRHFHGTILCTQTGNDAQGDVWIKPPTGLPVTADKITAV